MNILYALGSGAYGGMEFHVLDLARGFKKSNKIFIWCAEGELVNDFRKIGVDLTLQTPKYGFDLLYIYKLTNYLKSNKIDVIHAHELRVVGNAVIAAKLAGVRCVVTHTHTPISQWQIPWYKKALNMMVNAFLVNNFSDKEIALTPIVKSQKISEGIKPAKLEVIGNTVDLNRFRPKTAAEREIVRSKFFARYSLDSDTFVFGNVSRLTKEKGHEVLIRAFAEVCRDMKSVLLICGGGPLHKDYTKLTRELGIEDKVIITGYFEENHKENFFAIFDAFVMPSLAEGFGIVLLEASASEVPILASDLEVFTGIFGDRIEYFKTGDIRSLITGMSKFKSTEYIQGSLQTRRAYEVVLNNYSFEKFISSYERLYEGIISGKN